MPDSTTEEAAPTPESPNLNELGIGPFFDSELVVAFVGPVGADLNSVISEVATRLKVFNYTSERIRISSDVIPEITSITWEDSYPNGEFGRISAYMNAGNDARKASGDNSILANGVATLIARGRDKDNSVRRRHAYLVDSLKHPEEVVRLRSIYPQGFVLIGVHADEKRRNERLLDEKRVTADQAESLISRDEDEHLPYGQRTRDTFHLSDFFVRIDGDADQLRKSTWRILDILFGAPHQTPTFDEYAMFMAFSASLRSADLSRQVGAVISRRREIIATGANDCPKPGGGLYWPEYDIVSHSFKDAPGGRDYMRGCDSNRDEQLKIIDEILNLAAGPEAFQAEFRERLLKSQIADLTEYGRVVHAEMEALLACARNHGSTHHATLYCTTFPCHNCAKHIIAAGLARVVFVEPYPKSKALEFHPDAVTLEFSKDGGYSDELQPEVKAVRFEPFVGVGPRRFFDLFSMKLGSGYPLVRKQDDGKISPWRPEDANLRMQMLPDSYISLEFVAANLFNKAVPRVKTEGESGGHS